MRYIRRTAVNGNDAFLLYIKKSKSNGKRRDDYEKLLA